MSDATQKLLRHYQGQLLDPDSPTPLYHQLHTMLRDCIVGGVLNDGDRIPSEKELAEAFGVSRITPSAIFSSRVSVSTDLLAS